MSDLELSRELLGYEGDKKLTKLAVSTTQNHMKDMLQGEMGKDIKAVLNGEKKVSISKYKQRKFKISSWVKRLLRIL